MRISLIQTVEAIQTHEIYEWAREGTLKNLAYADRYLKVKGVTGMLIGGCIEKELPRKDIDIVIEPNPKINYRDFGIDWWIYNKRTKKARNLNGIIIRAERFESWARKNPPGLYISTYNCYKEISDLLFKELKGGEER